jgi:hypothetical protein
LREYISSILTLEALIDCMKMFRLGCIELNVW